jgi:hypothetical protein
MNSNRNYPIYLHIGYPKAASTTLQSSLFYKNPEINDFSPYQAAKEGDFKTRKVFKFLNNKEGTEEEIFEIFQNHIVPKLSKSKCNVFSSEAWVNNKDIFVKLERLKFLFTSYEPKIIVVTRNQYDLLKSLYYFLGGSLNGIEFNSLSSWFQFQLESQSNQTWLETLDFYQSLSYYSKWISPSDIGIFLFENMVNNPDKFTFNLSNFMNISETSIKNILNQKEKANPSSFGRLKIFKNKVPGLRNISFKSILTKTIYNNLKSNLAKIEKNIPKEDFTIQYKKIIENKYNESNNKLCNYFLVDKEELKKYNYPIK